MGPPSLKKPSATDYEFTPLVQAVEHVHDVLPSNPSSDPSHHDHVTDATVVMIDQPRSNNAEHDEYEEEEEQHRRKVIMGAGIASGIMVMGCLVGGPILAVLLFAGATHAVQQPQGSSCWVDTAQAVGELAVATADRARHINERHDLVEKSKKAAQQALQQAKHLNEKHRILEQTKQCVASSIYTTADYVKKNHLIEKCMDGMVRVVSWSGEQIAGHLQSNTTNKPGKVQPP